MIFWDDFGLPVDRTMDGGDSAMRAGMLATFSNIRVADRYETNGICVRHIADYPWNNPWNFSRDQMIPLVAGLYFTGKYKAVRRIFWRSVFRLFFAQNFERDYPGTTKLPWPHKFINDKFRVEKRLFDFADPLAPDHIWHLIKCGRLWFLYPFAVIGLPWFALSVALHGRSKHREHNQVICMCMVQGPWAVKLFTKLVPSWERDVRWYWDSRKENKYADLICERIAAVNALN